MDFNHRKIFRSYYRDRTTVKLDAQNRSNSITVLTATTTMYAKTYQFNVAHRHFWCDGVQYKIKMVSGVIFM